MTLKERLDAIRERIEMLGSSFATITLRGPFPLDRLRAMAAELDGEIEVFVHDKNAYRDAYAIERMHVQLGPFVVVNAEGPSREPTAAELERLAVEPLYTNRIAVMQGGST